MNELVLSKIDDIIEYIKGSDDYVKYIDIKMRLDGNKDIMNIINNIKDLQKKIVKEESIGNSISALEKEIDEKIALLNSYPIYVEFSYLQEDLNNIFQEIKNRIEEYINDKVN